MSAFTKYASEPRLDSKPGFRFCEKVTVRYLESGALVGILPEFRRRALAVSLVVAHRRNLSRRVRAFMIWVENVLAPYLE